MGQTLQPRLRLLDLEEQHKMIGNLFREFAKAHVRGNEAESNSIKIQIESKGFTVKIVKRGDYHLIPPTELKATQASEKSGAFPITPIKVRR